MTSLYFWISLILIFLLIEASTSIFYGFALALAAGIISVCLLLFPQLSDMYIIQAVIFAGASVACSIFLPRIFRTVDPEPQGLDVYIGKDFAVTADISGAHSIVLDGVLYSIDIVGVETKGEKVHITGRNGSKFSGVYAI